MAQRKEPKARGVKTQRKTRKTPVRAVEAEELRLVDRAGRVRAVLGLTRAGPRVALMREDGAPALELTLTGDGPSIRLSDEVGTARVFVGAIRGSARIGMADAKGAQRAFMGVNAAGKPTMTLYDGQQRRVWTAAR